jgi:hypothetical protein
MFCFPSLTITIRLAVSSLNVAWASFSAPADLVPDHQLVELHFVVEGGNLDRRLAAEDDHPHAVLFLAVLEDRAVEVFVHRVSPRDGDALRFVEQVNHRQPLFSADPLHFGQCQHHRDQHHRAQGQREEPPQRTQAGQAAEAEPPQQRQQRQEQQVTGTAKSE